MSWYHRFLLKRPQPIEGETVGLPAGVETQVMPWTKVQNVAFATMVCLQNRGAGGELIDQIRVETALSDSYEYPESVATAVSIADGYAGSVLGNPSQAGPGMLAPIYLRVFATSAAGCGKVRCFLLSGLV